MRRKLTPAFVAKPPTPVKDRAIYWDASQAGFGLMVTKSGHKSYVCQYRAHGKSHRMHLKDGLSLAAARQEAKALQGDVARGGNPLVDKRRAAAISTNTLRSVAESYFQREGPKLRSIGERLKIFDRLVYPRLGARPIDSIRRSDLVKLLDEIEDGSGPRMAHLTLAYISRLFSWHAGRDDDFRSPIVRGMGRVNAKERARKRVLSDEELKAIWSAAESSGTLFDRYVQFLLLTAVRRMEAARMTRAELAGDEWLIPAARVKNKQDHLVPLSMAALDILAKVPVIGKPEGFVFTNDGVRAFRDFAKCKAGLQARSGTSGWSLHDLRRTARSLMSRAGVDSDHGERALGHIIAGIRVVYDRHEYQEEKKAAFEKLAGQIDRILHPAVNVVPLRTAQVVPA
jgi:integrase